LNRYDDFDKYAAYEEEFDPINFDRRARRKRKPKARHEPKKSMREQLIEMAGDDFSLDHFEAFKTTYSPSLYEADWLIDSLRSFFEQDLISDVLALVKGGKEASVYRCATGPAQEGDYVAAKVYRPRKFRSLTNDQMYRDGRDMLTEKGEIIDNSDHRTMRAIKKNSSFGQQVEHTSWLMYEYRTLETLYEAGGAVPKPIEVNENTILMSYIGDEYRAASTLNKIRIADRDEAYYLYDVVMKNVDLMLSMDMIHGDLSPYNILYWEGEIVLIDFPQVANSRANSQAGFILRRDIERVCDYFVRQGVDCDAKVVFSDLYERYIAPDPQNFIADHWHEDFDDDDDE
jgi:RIO kinase 1